MKDYLECLFFDYEENGIANDLGGESEYRSASRWYAENREDLIKTLSKEQEELFNKMWNEYLLMNSYEQRKIFEAGFRICRELLR